MATNNPTTGISCPACTSTRCEVKDSRPGDRGQWIRRRRRCMDCQARFTTREMVVDETAKAMLVLPSGRTIPFDFEFDAIGKALGEQIAATLKEQMLDLVYQRGSRS